MRLRIHLPGAFIADLSGMRIVSPDDPVFPLRGNGKGQGLKVLYASDTSRPQTALETGGRQVAFDQAGRRVSFCERDPGDGPAPAPVVERRSVRFFLAAYCHCAS